MPTDKSTSPAHEDTHGEMIDPRQLDQTHFAEESAFDTYAPPSTKKTDSSEPPTKKNRRFAVFGLLFGTLLVVLVILTWMLGPRQGNIMPPDSNGEQTNGTGGAATTELQRQLVLLEQDIEQADPIESDLAFPPVDFSLTLEDALSVERLEELQRQRAR